MSDGTWVGGVRPEVTDERCDVCGHEWDAVPAGEIIARLTAVATGWRELLAGAPASSADRPSGDVWSVVEYAAHVRDVLTNLRDRVVLGLMEDAAEPHPMYGTARVEIGLYRLESAALLADDVPAAAASLTRTLSVLRADQWERPVRYGWPRDAWRTVRWVASQALHEAEHHLTDARRQVG